mgnify:FL=1
MYACNAILRRDFQSSNFLLMSPVATLLLLTCYRYILSCGKDSAVRLWDVGNGKQVKQYLGAQHIQLRCQVNIVLG